MEREQMDKVLDLTKEQVERKFGKGSLMRLGEQANIGAMPAIPTGSLALDAALGIGAGGLAWPCSRWTTASPPSVPSPPRWKIAWPPRPGPPTMALTCMWM